MPESTYPPRVDAVLFDFHGTLAQVEEPTRWVTLAAQACGVSLSPAKAAALADAVVTAGRAGGPLPSRIPPQLAEVWAERDLSTAAHRAAYTGLAASAVSDISGLPEALYSRGLEPHGWLPYPDAVSTLRALRGAGLRIALVSNIGFDIRPLTTAMGFAPYIDEWVLSYELGVCKPDPAIFRRACDALGVETHRALMVGDTPADSGAAAAGCPVLVLPSSPPGVSHGLCRVLALTGVSPPHCDGDAA